LGKFLEQNKAGPQKSAGVQAYKAQGIELFSKRRNDIPIALQY